MRLRFGGVVLCLLGGCARGDDPTRPPEAPAFAPEDQATCGVRRSTDKPLVVEWPSAERAELEARARSGLVVVAYSGCEMRLLSRCRAPGEYGYVAVTPKQDTITIHDEDELYANVPIGAARLSAKLATAGQLSVAMTMVGRLASAQDVSRETLDGSCDGATHVVSALTIGAFEFFAGAGHEVGAGVDVMGAGAGAKHSATRETLTRDGDPSACLGATGADTDAPDGCRAVIRLEVTPLLEGPTAAASPRVTQASPSPAPTDSDCRADRVRASVRDAAKARERSRAESLAIEAIRRAQTLPPGSCRDAHVEVALALAVAWYFESRGLPSERGTGDREVLERGRHLVATLHDSFDAQAWHAITFRRFPKGTAPSYDDLADADRLYAYALREIPQAEIEAFLQWAKAEDPWPDTTRFKPSL